MSDDISDIHQSLLNGGHKPIILGEAAADLGWPVFACKADKKPLTEHGFKDASHDRGVILRQFANSSAQMIGCPTGSESGFIVIDVDIKRGARGMEWLDAKSEKLPPTRTHKTLSGGLHLLFRAPDGVEIGNSASRIAPGVDVRGQGGYVIVPPSPGYAVADPVEMAEMPAWLVVACMKPEPPPPPATPSQPSQRASSDSDLSRYANRALDDAFNKVRNAPEGTRNPTLNNEALALATMLWWGEFTRSTVEGELGRAAAEAGLDAEEIQKTLKSAIDAGLKKAQRPKPEPRPMPERPPEPPPHTEYPERYVTSASIDAEVPEEDPSHAARSPDPEPEAPKAKAKTGKKAKPEAEEAKPETPEKEQPEWAKYFQRDDKGQAVANLANALTALRNAPEMDGVIAYDEMMCQLMFKRGIANCKIKDAKTVRAVEDCEVSAIQEWMQRHDVRRISKETVQQAVELVGRENKFHPVLDYLYGLKWDKVPRLNGFLAKYFNCTEQKAEYLASIGRWFLISMVARIVNPGGKCDYMVVLEGEQGLMKSTACGILGDKWFDDTLPEIRGGDDVRVSQHLRGKWLIEVGELASIKAADAENLKTFLTRRNERYIPKYGHNEIHEPRRCVFVGTTNKHAWLCDETGGRRFWPVKVGDVIDLDGLKRDRDQLFAEAVVAYRAKEVFWPTRKFEADFIKPEQEIRYIADAWEAKIDAFLNPAGGKERNRVTINETAVLALKIDLKDLTTASQRRITSAFTRLGWLRARDNKGRWWQRKGFVAEVVSPGE